MFTLWKRCQSESEFNDLTIPDTICEIEQWQSSNDNYAWQQYCESPVFQLGHSLSIDAFLPRSK